MAREEADREDLLREATALVERIEFAIAPDLRHATGSAAAPGANDSTSETDRREPTMVVGFRAGGSASFYFGADPVYHFNVEGQLRRSYSGGLLYKAELGRLVSLERVRSASEVELRRREMSDKAQREFLMHMRDRLAHLAVQLLSGKVIVLGQVPDDRDIRARVLGWLEDHQDFAVAQKPNV